MTHYPVTAEQIREKLQGRIDEYTAELSALKGVKIDTKHKTLTNRAISGEGARVGDYMDLGKALYVSYAVKYQDGHTKYMSRDITAYSYNNLDGSEIGVEGYRRISRTITPAELQVLLQDVTDSVASALGQLKSEYRRAETIAKQHNVLVDKVNAFNNSVSYASEVRF